MPPECVLGLEPEIATVEEKDFVSAEPVVEPGSHLQRSAESALSRNPSWTRDELILALDLYFRSGRRQLDASR